MPSTLQPKTKNSIPVVIVSGNRGMDDFMHAADVFEPFKALATVHTLDIEFDKEPSQAVINSSLNAIKGWLEKDHRVVAVFSPGCPGGYVDNTVKTISNGQTWRRLDDVLKSYLASTSHA